MEKYTQAEMNVIEFEDEDVITTSSTCGSGYYTIGFDPCDTNYCINPE